MTFEEVYRIVSLIPPGRVATYGQIAKLCGSPRAARFVGMALRSVPAGRDLPYHRVVNMRGELAPEYVFGSGEYQRALLEDEGISFLPGGLIDMKKHRWQVLCGAVQEPPVSN